MSPFRNRAISASGFAFIILLIFALTAAFSGGCGCGNDEKEEDEYGHMTDAHKWHDEQYDAEETEQGIEETGGKKVYMCGRSVMADWFVHWKRGDWDWSSPVNKNGFTFVYKELACPPEIAESFREIIQSVEDDAVVFFKLCFVDFYGGTAEQASNNLRVNQGIVQNIVRAADTRSDLKLIIGNVLPVLSSSGDELLKGVYKDFNEFLIGVERDNADKVFVFDMYSVLSDSNGFLRAEYAISQDDSHLNRKAYDALDDRWFSLLEVVSR